MARFVTGETFGATDTVTATKLNNAVNNAKISTDSVDGSTIELNSDALRIKDSGVTKAKIENVVNMKVLGNTSGSATAPQEVAILDEDNMSSDSATSLATQQSIKKYVDDNSGLQSSSASAATGKLYVAQAQTAYDLDLSSVVGSNKAMVIINIDGGGTSTGQPQSYVLRTKGGIAANNPSGNSLGTGSIKTGSSGAGLSAGSVIVVTDSSGVIEYASSTASTGGTSTGANYTVVAFQVIS